MAEKLTGARLFARMLEAYGVTHVFFMDAILRRALAEMEDFNITRVLGHSEKAVAYMADGYARISGKPGVCMAQSVGAANLAAGMQDPYLGHSAVVAITGKHVAPFQHRNAYQEVEHSKLYASVTKFHASVDALEQIPQLMRQAFREATTGTPRPVHLDMAGFTGDAITAPRRHVRRAGRRSAHALSRVPASSRSGCGEACGESNRRCNAAGDRRRSRRRRVRSRARRCANSPRRSSVPSSRRSMRRT